MRNLLGPSRFAALLFILASPSEWNHALADRADDAERRLIQSLIDVNLSVKQAAQRGEFRLRSTERDGVVVRICDATLRCGDDGCFMAYEVREGATFEDAKQAEKRSGRLVRWKTTRVFVDDTRKTAFISYDSDHDALGCYLVQPSECYFSYVSQIPLQEILTSKGTWDYGDRVLEIVESEETIEVQLQHSSLTQPVIVEFSKALGGLFTRFDHSSSNAAPRMVICEWDEVQGVSYAKLLEYRDLIDEASKSVTTFSLKVLEFRPNCGLTQSECTVASLNLGKDYTRAIAYKNGQSKTFPAERVLVDELKDVAERIKSRIGR